MTLKYLTTRTSHESSPHRRCTLGVVLPIPFRQEDSNRRATLIPSIEAWAYPGVIPNKRVVNLLIDLGASRLGISYSKLGTTRR